MFTHKDIKTRSIFVVNCLKERNLRVASGELMLEEENEDGKKVALTKMPFQKILALFIIGHATITTPIIDKCKKYNVALVVVKPNLRPVFFFSATADANYLVRKKQFELDKNDISVAKILMLNKTENQLRLLEKTRQKNDLIQQAKQQCFDALERIPEITDYCQLMGTEGVVAKCFFEAYFQDLEWAKRMPRAKTDALNATLDIGYSILFNFVECFVRMFGFDVYIGVYHRLWFKRKSLICDLMEPFRCIIDRQVRLAFNRKQCSKDDFTVFKGEYVLKHEKNADYHRLFFEALIPYKTEFFIYMQTYYRCFMQGKSVDLYPKFLI